MYDVAIIGTGPAGFSAALNAEARKLSYIWIGNPTFSEKASKAEKIDNYPGLQGISGKELCEAYKRHADSLGMMPTDETVQAILETGKGFMLSASKGEFEAKSVILCTGAAQGKELNGEREYLGRGVSYCATCDGRLYEGKRIGVLCGSEKHRGEVRFLAGLADKLYYFPLVKDTDEYPENTVVIRDAFPKEAEGDMKLRRVKLTNGETIELDALFLLREAIAADTLLYGLETESGHITVDRVMKTSVKGCFAAGDCTGRPYQYAKAIGEGNVALHSAIEYLNENK